MTLNWEPLSSGDPMPGDPEAIQQLSSLLGAYATECSSSAAKLNNLGDIDWQSDAADAFRDRKDAFVPKLTLVSQRLSSTSTILRNFAGRVSEYQSTGQNLRTSAQQLVDEIQAIAPMAAAQQSYIERQEVGVLVGKPPIPWSGPDYIAQETQLKASYAKVQLSFNELVSEYASTSQACASQLQGVSHDPLANNFLSVFSHDVGNVGSVVEGGLHAINNDLPGVARILHDIANVAGVLAILPIPGFQEIAGAIFLGASLGALAVDVTLKVENRAGVTWGELGMDVFQVATAGVLNKANNMVKVAEDASDAKSGFVSWIVSSSPDSHLASTETYLENFPSRLNVESKTLEVLGQINSGESWAERNGELIQQTWNRIKSSLLADLSVA